MDDDSKQNLAISDIEFEEKVLENDRPVVVEFGAEWCGSCHIMAPVISQLVLEYDGRIQYCKIDVDTYDLTSRKYGIKDLPTLLFFKDGEVIEHVVGSVPRKLLEELFSRLLD